MESMTGFGRAEAAEDGFAITIEAKSVNHKSLSISLKLPEALSGTELDVRKIVKEMFQRGRIILDVLFETGASGGSSAAIDLDSAREYISIAEGIVRDNENIREMSVGELLRLPGVVGIAKSSVPDSEELTKAFMSSVSKALVELRESRRREGAVLAPIFSGGFESIREMTDPVLDRQIETVQERYERLKERISELLGDVSLDEDRLMQELALMADRSDITEEVQRLICHLDHALEILDENSIGRKLEFLIQEMHRELNTMGAKVSDSEQSLKVIEMKNILSSLKEQAANIE